MSKSNEVQVSFYETFDLLIEEVYDPILHPEKRFAVYNPSEDKLSYLDKIELENGKVLIPNQTSLIDNRVVLLPTEAGGYISEVKLLEEIKSFIKKYLDIHPFYLDLVAYYVLTTWVFDRLAVVPYLRSFGDYGSGKTRFVQTVGALCYKPCFVSGSLTPSPIFRMIEAFQGTLVINELDLLDKDSDIHSDLTKILNNGYEKGLVVLRVEGDKKRDVKAYKTFSPKIFSTRKRFKDQALESRIITIPMQPTRRTDIPIVLPESFWEEAQRLRNNLLMFRFRKLREPLLEDKSERLAGIEPRLKQTLLPIFSLIENAKLESQILKFAGEYQKQLIQDRGFELEGIVAGKLVSLVQLNQQVTVKMVTEEVAKELEDSRYKITSQRVGKIIRENLGFKTQRTGASGAYHVIPNKERIEYLIQRYGLESSESSEGSEVDSNLDPNSLNLLNFYTPEEEIIKEDLTARVNTKEDLSSYIEPMGTNEREAVRKILEKENLTDKLHWFNACLEGRLL